MSDTLNPHTEELSNKIELFDIVEEKEEEIKNEELTEAVKNALEELKEIVSEEKEVPKNIVEEEKEDFIKEKDESNNDQKVSILSFFYRNLCIFSCSSK